MDWSSIGGAALAGALGGAVGALLGGLMARLFPEKSRTIVTIAFTVACAIIVPRIAEAVFEKPATAAQIETEMLSHPAFGSLARAWKQAEPASFSDAIGGIEQAVQSGQDRAAAVNNFRISLLSAATPRFAYLADHDVLEMIAVARDQYRALATSQPAICHPMFMGLPFGDVTPYLPDALEQRERAVMEAAFRADMRTPRAVLRGDELNAAIDEILADTRSRIGDDVNLLGSNANLAGQESRYCAAVAEVFDSALKLPPERAAAFMRGMKEEA
jgi:hypothetical protein